MAENPWLLDNLEIAQACPASWDEMQGNDKARFCPLCAKNVYDFAAMTRAESEALIREKEGQMCARLFRREDGSVMTSDCPQAKPEVRPSGWKGVLWAWRDKKKRRKMRTSIPGVPMELPIAMTGIIAPRTPWTANRMDESDATPQGTESSSPKSDAAGGHNHEPD